MRAQVLDSNQEGRGLLAHLRKANIRPTAHATAGVRSQRPLCSATKLSSVAAFARNLPAQKTEARLGCSVLNWMTRLGTPVSQRIA
jgi:hypothetical protein